MNLVDIIAIAAGNVTPFEAQLAIVANLVVCAGLAWSCVCRATKSSMSTTQPVYRYLYAAAGTLAVLAAVAWPLLGPWPHLGLLVCYLIGFKLTAPAWADGPPPIARKTIRTFRRAPWNL